LADFLFSGKIPRRWKSTILECWACRRGQRAFRKNLWRSWGI